MSVTWEVDHSSTTTTYIYKVDGTEKARVTNLKENLLTGETPSETDPTGVTITKNNDDAYVVKVTKDALPATGTVSVSGTGVTLEMDNNVDKSVFKEYNATHTADSTLTLTATYTSGWYTASNTSISHQEEGTPRNSTMVISGNGLRNDVTPEDISFDKTNVNTPITLKSSAFADTLTEGSVVNVSGNIGNVTLALGTGVNEAGKAADTSFSWATTEVKDGETVTSVTAHLQKALQEGWTVDNISAAKTLTYKKPAALDYATIEGLAASTTADSLEDLLPANDATDTAIALVKANIPTTDGAAVILKNSAIVSIPGYAIDGVTTTTGTTVTPAFTLELGSDINTEPQTKEDGEITLKIQPKANDTATTVDATVNQHMNAGWTLDTADGATKNKKITYTAANDVTLATITGLATTATTVNASLDKETKTITLKADALTTGDVVLARGSSEATALSYENAEIAYSLSIAGGINSAYAPNGEYDLNVGKETDAATSASATVKEKYNAYWSLGENNNVENTKITYHAAGTSTACLAKVTGLAADAQKGTDVVFHITDSSRTITLNEGAFPTSGLSAGTSKVTLDVSGDTGSKNFKLAYGNVQKPGENDGIVVTGSDSTFKVQQTKTAGWSLAVDEDETATAINVFTYLTPAAADLATITVHDGASGISAARDFSIEGTIVKVASGALSAGDKTSVEIENEDGQSYTLALGGSVTKFGEETGTAYLAVYDNEIEDDPPLGDKLAEVRMARQDGWHVVTKDDVTAFAADDDDSNNDFKAGNIVYRSDEFNTLAKITGLANGASYAAAGDSTNTLSLSGTIVTLKKAALPGKDEVENYTVTTLQNTAGYSYTLALGEDITDEDKEPNLHYSGADLTVDDGNATITGTLNEGWTLDDDSITYIGASESATLATIGGLSTAAAAANVSLGTKDDDPTTADVDEYDKNVVYLSLDALTAGDVTLGNEEDIGDFRFVLVNDDDEVTVTALGYEDNYAWQISGTSTARFMKGSEQGWSLASDSSITYDERIAPADDGTTATEILRITNLAGGLSTNNDDLTEADFLDPTKSVIGTMINEDFVDGLSITEAYTPAEGNSAAVNGTILLKRNVLGTGTLELKGTENANYDLELFDNATDSDATEDTFVPTSKDATIRYWILDGNAATYREGAAEYWAVNGKKVTHTGKTSVKTLAKITGVSTAGLQVMDGNALSAAAVYEGTDGKYVIENGFVYSGEEATTDYTAASASKVIRVSGAYSAATSDTPAQYAQIIIGEAALNESDVAFTSGSDKYRLALDTEGGLSEATPTDHKWAITGTNSKTAEYYGVFGEGYLVVDKDDSEDNYGKGIKYLADNDEYKLATITGLNKDVTANEGVLGTTDSAGEFEAFESGGISVDSDEFVLTADVLGTENIVLTNDSTQRYTLALDDDDAIIVATTEAEKTDLKGSENVWRLDGTTAYYRNITPTYYTPADDGMSITTTKEQSDSKDIYATVKNLASGLVEKDDKIYAATDTDHTHELLKIGTQSVGTDTQDIITVNAEALDSNKTLTLTNGTDSKYAFVLGTDSGGESIATVGISSGGSWVISGTNATYKANFTAGWLVNSDGTRITNYAATKTPKTIVTISGLKSGLSSADFAGVAVDKDDTASDIEIPTAALGTSDITLKNDKLPNDAEFDYGIKLASADSEAAAAAITGVERWSLDDTTLSLNNIHDAHHEDLATQTANNTSTSGVSKTVIKYVKEDVDPYILTITNLKEGLELDTEAAEPEDFVNGRYASDTPVAGVEVNDDKVITLGLSVVSSDPAKVTTLTNKDGVSNTNAYKLKMGDDLVEPGGEDGDETYDSFKINKDATTVELWRGETAGYELSTATQSSTITYVAPKQTTKLATISGLNTTGLVVGGESDTDTNQVGTKATDGSFSAAITFTGDTDAERVFKIGKAALKADKTAVVSVDKGTLELGTDITGDATNYIDDYAWATKTAGTYTYNKGNTAGWELDSNKIVYHEAAYDEPVAKISGLKNGLKVNTVTSGGVTTYGLFDAKNNKAVSANGITITITNWAVNAKDILLKESTDGVTNIAGGSVATGYKLALDQTMADATTKANTYVENKNVTPVWAQDTKDKSKYTYTVTTTAGYDVADEADVTEGYAAEVKYTKAGKTTTTLTGLATNLNISEDKKTLGASDQVTVVDGDDPTITVAKAALGENNVTLKNTGTSYKLVLDGVDAIDDSEVWTISKGTATYIQPYGEKNYVKKSDTEYTYSATPKDVTLATITGLNKDITAEKISKSVAATNYGIYVTTKDIEGTTTDVIEMTDRRTFGTGNVVLKNSTAADATQYRFYIDNATDFYEVTYKADNPLWTFSKGTLTLSTGTSNSWDYKNANTNKVDYNTLAIVKGKTTAVATVKGLATDLELTTNEDGTVDDTKGIGLFAKTTTASSGILAEAAAPTPVITLDTSDEDTYLIKLTSDALIDSPKKNSKVTLTLPKNSTLFALDASGVDKAEAANMNDANKSSVAYQEKNKWSVNKGVATYQYKTSAGWKMDDAGKNFTYSNAIQTTTLAKISGLDTTLTTFKDTTNTDKKGNPGDIPIDDTAFNTLTGITVEKEKLADDKTKTTFTLTDADKLAGKNVTLATTDKTNSYALFADAALAPQEYETKVTVDGKKGTVTLTDGISDGYVTPDETVNNKPNKNYGTTVTYSKEKPNKALFTITGLKTDGATEGFTLSGKVTTEPDGANVNIKGDSVLKYDEDKKTISITDTTIFNKKAVTITGTDGYTFASIGTNDDADKLEAPIVIIKSGVINIVDRAEANKYAISTDGKKINYNTKAVDTILATVKGLNKDIGQKDDDTTNLYINTTPKAATPTWSDAVGSVSFTKGDGKYTGTVTLKDGALAKSNITFTLGKTAEEGDFSVTLADDVMTESGDWKNITEWTISNNGTASYKNYNKGYYYDDDKGGYKYKAEDKGTTYATISGLNTALTKADIKGFADSTEIKLDKTMLADKNITLKNNINENMSTYFTLALDTTNADAAKKVTAISTLTADTKFVKGKLNGTQSAGYLMSADNTSITYLKNAKTSQLATLTGVDTSKTSKDITVSGASVATKGGTITLTADNLTGKSVTLTTTDLADNNNFTYTITGFGTGVNAPTVTPATTNGGWSYKNNTATFTGLTTEGYKIADSRKSVTYTKAAGTAEKGTTAEKPVAVTKITNVKGIEDGGSATSVTVTGNVNGKAATMSNGLIPVTFKNTDNIAGSNDADTIILDGITGASVKGGKGDDKITLGSGSGKDVILYANNDGNDIVANFSASDKIKLTGGKVTSVTQSGDDVIVKVGTGSIKLSGYSGVVNIVDNKDKSLWSTTATSSSDILLEDDNYSMDAAALSDIVEPFHASYTPYDFDAGLDLVKQNSFTPAITYTSNDKK